MGKNACLNYFKKQFRGSTVLEVIVSLTICMIIFSISIRFILKMQTTDNMETRQRAELLISRAAAGFEAPEDLNPVLYNERNLTLQADTLSDETYPGLNLVNLSVRLSGGKMVRQVSFYVRKAKQETP